MRIRNILTTTSPRLEMGLAKQRQQLSDQDVTVEVERIVRGPYSLEFAAEIAIAGPYILEAVQRAERDGVDAIVIECMADPGIRAAREVAKIPVISSAKAGMAFALSLGMRICIIRVANGGGLFEETIRSYGLWNHVCSFKRVDIPPADLAEAKTYCYDRIAAVGRAAVEEDRADVILLGCTAMSAYAKRLQEELGIPIVEPASCAIRLAIDLVKLGLTHSKKCYPTPPVRPEAPGSISVWNPTGNSAK